jgi:hypothetical protein
MIVGGRKIGQAEATKFTPEVRFRLQFVKIDFPSRLALE